MPNVLAIISKAQFEAAHPRATEGDELGFARYASTHAALSPLTGGGSLFLVTVRPPDERLWLIGELVEPTHDGKAWKSSPSTVRVRDITALIPRLRFSNGKGLSPKKGALGMSLQTPRQLTDDDTDLLRGSAASTPATKRRAPVASTPAPPRPSEPIAPAPAEALTLTDVLGEWRRTRAPELEELIDTLSRHFVRAWPELDPEADDYDAQWNERAKVLSPENLPTLIPGLWSDPKGAIPLRVRQLLELGADPRLGEGLLKMVDEPPFTASSNFSTWTVLFKALPSMVDRRAAKRLEARTRKKGGDSQFWPKLNGWIRAVLEELPEPAALDRAQATSVAKRLKQAKALASGPIPAAVAPVAKKKQEPTAFPTVTAALEAAITATQATRYLDALEPLRQAWANTREQALVECLSRLDTLGSQQHERFDLGKATELQAAWLDAARTYDARRVTPLLASLFTNTRSDAEERLKAMADWPADPRVATQLVGVIKNSHGYLGARAMIWKLVYELLVAHADPRFATTLEENAKRLELANLAFDRNRAERPHALATIAPYLERARAQIALTPNEKALLTTLRDAIGRAESSKKASASPDKALALLQAIADAPDDPTPRLVYADFLAERGDPRAEFINLSLALARGEKVKGTYEACAKKLGILKQLPNYHLGLQVKAATGQPQFADDAARDAWLDDVNWASVRELSAGDSSSDADPPSIAQLVERAPLYALTHLHAKGTTIAAAARRDFPWRIERLSLYDSKLPSDLKAGAFPALHTVVPSMWNLPAPGFFTNPLFIDTRTIELAQMNTWGELPIDVFIVDGATLPKLERITVRTAAMDFEVAFANGQADVVFILRSLPGPTDTYFLSTLARLEKVPAKLVRSLRLEPKPEDDPVNEKALALARAAVKHLRG